LQNLPAPPPRPRANYRNAEYQAVRRNRLAADHGLCVFCKGPATTVQHITYRRAGGQENLEDLRSLCRLCHDAVTMLEYGHGMEMDRINPEDPQWREAILQKREQIIKYRSQEMRRRHLQPEEV
jgi:5-methylcytosine-specific restriction endonuclease McrA